MHKILVSFHAFDYGLGESNQPYQCITDVYVVPWVVCLPFSVPNECGLRFLWSKCYVAHWHPETF